MDNNSLSLYNSQPVDIREIPVFRIGTFRNIIIDDVESGKRIISLFAVPRSRGFVLYAVLADDNAGLLSVLSSEISDKYPSLTPDCPQVHLFEREIAEQWAVIPEGHPWLKPVRFHSSRIPGRDAWNRKSGGISPSVMEFYHVEGEEIHEVAVGPVHAGIIEPGHFRFQCHGEDVLNLEISLGYQHRGIEKALTGGPDRKSIQMVQAAAGDTSIGHTLAYCQLLEALAGGNIYPRAESIRGIALELERLANHTGDLGALAGDIGYLPTSSFCGRIRGDFLNMTAVICGSRFGRSLVVPGGTGFDIGKREEEMLAERIHRGSKDVTVAVNLLWDTASVLARFEDTGKINSKICRDLGLVGVPARACGIELDSRFNFPAGIYRFVQIPVSTWDTGDVFARAYVRWLEIQRSLAFIQDQIAVLPGGDVITDIKKPGRGKFAASLVEGWRGQICHTALTDADGSFRSYKIVDPSFYNWTGLAIALRNQQISDFPLCNKSFNLSYCGFDL